MRRSPSIFALLMLAGCAAPPGTTSSSVTPHPVEAAPIKLDLPAPTPEPEVVPAAPAAWRLVSRPGRARASSGFGELASDGDRQTEWNPRTPIRAGQPQWLALPLERPIDGRLAVVWHGHGMHYLYGEYGRPRSYDVQVSADSTDGADGTWRTVETVHDNPVRSRISAFDAAGARWVRLLFKDVWDGRHSNEPYVREAEVYAADRPGAADAWLLLGDSVTSVGFDPSGPDVFADEVARRHAPRRPMLLSGGTGGDESVHAVERLRVALPTLPAGSVVGLCYGSNDAKRGVTVEAYRAQLQAAIDLIRAEGHQPMLAVVPWSLNGRIAEYAEACRELIAANALPPGPDFYAYFKAHPEELRSDKVHPTEEGVKAMQRLWAEAAAFRYRP